MTAIEFHHAVQSQYKPLRSYAFKLVGDSQDANDLVQETMLRAFSNKDKFREGSNLKGWLYTMMKNIFINNYRRMVNSRIISDDTESQYLLHSPGNSEHNKASSLLALRDINFAINSLSEKLKRPFLLNFEGYHYDEIANTLGIPLGTVKIRIHTARQRLQFMLSSYGHEYGLKTKKMKAVS